MAQGRVTSHKAVGAKVRLGRAILGLTVMSGATVDLGHALVIIGVMALTALILLALCNQTYPIIQMNPFKLTWRRIVRPPHR